MSEWIACKDRLPDTRRDVLVGVPGNNEYQIARLIAEPIGTVFPEPIHWRSDDGRFRVNYDCHYWAFLPPPPEPDK